MILLGIHNRMHLQFGGHQTALILACLCLWWPVRFTIAQSTEGNSSGNPRSQDSRTVDTLSPQNPDALLEKVQPAYPPIAKAARVSGTVVINVVIGRSGTIENMHAVSGPPLLQQAALDSVRAWRFKPYLVGGDAMEARATVTVTFSLSADGAASVSSATSAPRPALSGLPAPPPPRDGKALVYFYRPVEEQQGEPVQVFVDGDLRAELNAAEHVSSEMTPGTIVVSAQSALEGEGQYFPPKLRWPICLGDPRKPKCGWETEGHTATGGHGCEAVNWRRIGEAPTEDLALCLRELQATQTALANWFHEAAAAGSDKSGEMLLFTIIANVALAEAHSNYELSYIPKIAEGPEGIGKWLHMCGPGSFPKPPSRSAQQSKNGAAASFDAWSNCTKDVDEAFKLLRPKQPLRVELEKGKTYYVDCESANLAIVDATTGAYELSELQPIDLIRAAGRGDLLVIKALLAANTNVNSKLADGTTPLFAASQNGRLEAVQFLLGAQADLNMKRADGLSPLIAASENGNLEVVRALIRAGADINSKPTDRFTALTAASAGGNLGAVNALLEAKADVNAKRADGFTPLVAASENGRLDVVEALLHANADVNARTANGMTALMLAASSGNLDLVRVLVDAKANVSARSATGMTAYNYASISGRRDVMQLLKSADSAVR